MTYDDRMSTSMRRLAVLLALSGCGGDEDGIDDGGGEAADASGGGGEVADASSAGEPAELAGIVAAHNQVRADHGIDPLSWDPALAAIAQGWAERCEDAEAPIGLIDHNPDRSDSYGSYVGENVYGSSGAIGGPVAVDAWAAEEASYDLDTNSCDGVCGHYTQIVWASTTLVGCAFHLCPGLDFGNTVVCDYAPGGNDGGRPY